MKIELIKKTNISETVYSVELNGEYVAGSATSHLETANAFYDKLKANPQHKTIEILKSEEL